MLRPQKRKNPAIRGGVQSGGESLTKLHSGIRRGCGLLLVRLAQHVAAAPDGFDEVAAFGSIRELLAQLVDEAVDDLEFRLVQISLAAVPKSGFAVYNAFPLWEYAS
jgi:hypothetical protein